MNLFQCQEWARRAERLLGRGGRAAASWLSALGERAANRGWQACLEAGEGPLSLGLRGRDSQGRPLASLWEAKTGRSLAQAEVVLRRAKAGAWLRDPDLAAMRPLAALCPLRELVTEWAPGPGGSLAPLPSWSLRLGPGQTWSSLCATPLLRPLASRAELVSRLLLDFEIDEVRFEGGRARAWFASR